MIVRGIMMSWIFGLVLRLPAWFILVLAGAVLYFGTQIVDVLEADNRKVEAAARLPAPDMRDYLPGDPIETGEIALRAKIFDDAIYRFSYHSDGPEDFVEYFLFLESPDATATDREFSAVVIFESDNVARINAWWDKVLVDPDNDMDLAALRGYASQSDVLAYETSDALYYLGGTRGENFVYIRAFVDGREAFYRHNMMDVDLIRYGVWLGVAVLMLWAIVRQFWGNRIMQASPKVSGAKTAFGVASAAAGLVSLGDDEDVDEAEEDEEDDSNSGMVFAIGKILFGFLWKRHKKAKATEQAQLEQPEPPVGEPIATPAVETQKSIYSPHRQLYSEDGEPIDLEALQEQHYDL